MANTTQETFEAAVQREYEGERLESPVEAQIREIGAAIAASGSRPPATVPVHPEVWKQLAELYMKPSITVLGEQLKANAPLLESLKKLPPKKTPPFVVGPLQVKADPAVPLGEFRFEYTTTGPIEVSAEEIREVKKAEKPPGLSSAAALREYKDWQEARFGRPDKPRADQEQIAIDEWACAWCGADLRGGSRPPHRSWFRGERSWRPLSMFSSARPYADESCYIASFCNQDCSEQARELTTTQLARHQAAVMRALGWIPVDAQRERYVARKALAAGRALENRNHVLAELELRGQVEQLQAERDSALRCEREASEKLAAVEGERNALFSEKEDLEVQRDAIRRRAEYLAREVEILRAAFPARVLPPRPKLPGGSEDGRKSATTSAPAFIPPGRVRAMPVMAGGPVPIARPAVVYCQTEDDLDVDQE